MTNYREAAIELLHAMVTDPYCTDRAGNLLESAGILLAEAMGLHGDEADNFLLEAGVQC